MRYLIGLAAAAVVCSAAPAADAKYALSTDNTDFRFTGTKPGGKHDGTFKNFSGTATMTNNDATTTKLEVVIDTTSLHADDPKLTGHLKSPDFFDVKTNPTAKFVSSKVVKAGDSFKVTGDLTINGKTKEITFPALVGTEDGAFKLAAEFTIKRSDFELGSKFPPEKIHDDVTLKVNSTAKP